jgi:hypothetical protein
MGILDILKWRLVESNSRRWTSFLPYYTYLDYTYLDYTYLGRSSVAL